MLFKMFRKTLCCIKMVEHISITLLSLSETCPTIHKTGCQKKNDQRVCMSILQNLIFRFYIDYGQKKP